MKDLWNSEYGRMYLLCVFTQVIFNLAIGVLAAMLELK